MQAVAVLICALALAAAAPNGKEADKTFATNQLAINRLFTKLENPNHDKEQQEIGNKFAFNPELFTNAQAVKNFQNAYQQGFLPRGEVFNYFNPNHLEQAIQLFDVFYFAKDFDTFYQAACWARDRINEGQFAYALSVAVLNRPDTQGIALLPQAELNPFVYFDSRLIQQAQKFKQQGHNKAYARFNSSNDFNYNQQYLIEKPEYPFENINQNEYETENQANQYTNLNQWSLETRLFYYYNDVSISQQFAFEQLKNPAWLNSQKYQNKSVNKNQNSGENFYYYLQQFLARYNMERFVNDLGNIQPILLDGEIPFGFSSDLQYSNGQNVPNRPDNYNINNANTNALQQARNIDRRLADAVDSNLVLKADGSKLKLDAQNGVEVLANLIQNNENSVNPEYYADGNGYYGYFDILRKAVGSVINPYNQNTNAPSSLESNDIASRDVAFYQVISRVVNFFQNFKNKLAPYTKEEVSFPGVKITAVNTDKLLTTFENYEYDFFNAIDYSPEEQPQNVKYVGYVRQLNAKPFTFQIQVNSDKEGPAVVRVFIAPKFNFRGVESSLEQTRQNFVEIDRFVVNLKSGDNNIERMSQQSTRFVQPPPTTLQNYHNALTFLKGGAPLIYDENFSQREATFPANWILPKGYRFGQTHIIAVSINPFQGEQPGPLDQPQDKRPQGFPFDRVVDENLFEQAENVYFKSVKVFNKYEEDSSSSNATKQ